MNFSNSINTKFYQAQPLNKLGNNLQVMMLVLEVLCRTYPRGFKYKINNPSFLERGLLGGAVGLLNRGKNLVDDGVKAIWFIWNCYEGKKSY